MQAQRLTLILSLLLIAAPPRATAQSTIMPDSARAELTPVLRAFYLNLATQNWDALAAYVLSPKLLERRGAPGDRQMITRDRTRRRDAPAGMGVTAGLPVEQTCRCRAAAGLHQAWTSSACCTSRNGGLHLHGPLPGVADA
jgi:hypothetical protein